MIMSIKQHDVFVDFYAYFIVMFMQILLVPITITRWWLTITMAT